MVVCVCVALNKLLVNSLANWGQTVQKGIVVQGRNGLQEIKAHASPTEALQTEMRCKTEEMKTQKTRELTRLLPLLL